MITFPFDEVYHIVRDAGGEWVGTQSNLNPDIGTMMIFRNPVSQHVIREVVPSNRDPVEFAKKRVPQLLKLDTLAFKKRIARVKVVTLTKIEETLRAVAEQIRELLEGKE